MDGQGPQLAVITEDRHEAHEHEPEPGTIYTSTGLPVTGRLSEFSSYPIDAVCLICGEPLRRDTFFAVGPGNWRLKYPEGR